MKKTLALLLSLVLVFALCACGTQAPAATQAPTATGGEATNAPAAPVAVKMATGGTSGTYYGFCGVVAQVLNEKLADQLSITVESTGASKANIQLVEAGEDQLAIVQNDIMYYANTGTVIFDAPVTNFSAVMSCYPEDVQIIANTSITSVADLAGKKVSVGASDSGVRYNAEQILAAYGLTFDDCTVSYESFADSVDSLKNGTIDAAFLVAGPPTTAVTELATSYNFNLLELDDEHIAILQKDYGFYTTDIIPAGTYSCVDHDVKTVAVMATIIAANDLPEETVYAFLKGMFDNKADIAAGHVKGELIDLNTAVSGISIPFHPGAAAYYADQGITVG
jgi:TRAP transporter TAXI family solute receptor